MCPSRQSLALCTLLGLADTQQRWPLLELECPQVPHEYLWYLAVFSFQQFQVYLPSPMVPLYHVSDSGQGSVRRRDGAEAGGHFQAETVKSPAVFSTPLLPFWRVWRPCPGMAEPQVEAV